MHSITGATNADIKPASLMMWESYDYVREKQPKDFFYHLLVNEPNLNPEQLRLLWIDDRIAATVLVAKREMNSGNGSLVLGGIGDVAVHPDFRGKGLSIAILQNAVDYMIANGYDVSTLYSGHEGLYEKVGYQRISSRGHVAGVVAGDPVAFTRTKDWSIAKTLFERSISLLPGGMIRSQDYWEQYIVGRWLRTADIVYSKDNSAYVMVVDAEEANTVSLVDGGYADSIDQLVDLLRTEFAGMQLSSPSTDVVNPLLQAIKAAVIEPDEQPWCGIMARTLSDISMPPHFLDMDVDRF